jgi:predicted N-acetyltransferase YhbS
VVYRDSYEKKLRKTHITSRHLLIGPFAVSPDYQGKGYGSKLVRNKIEEIKGKGIPLYLQIDTEEAYKIYSHLGLELIEKTTIPNMKIEHWSMILYP